MCIEMKEVLIYAAVASVGWNGVDFLFGVVFRYTMSLF